MTNQPIPPIPDNGLEQRITNIVREAVESQMDWEAYYKWENPDVIEEIMELFQQELHTAIEEERKRFVEGLKIVCSGEAYAYDAAFDLLAKYSPSDKETTE